MCSAAVVVCGVTTDNDIPKLTGQLPTQLEMHSTYQIVSELFEVTKSSASLIIQVNDSENHCTLLVCVFKTPLLGFEAGSAIFH
jgi:hypothetical protein